MTIAFCHGDGNFQLHPLSSQLAVGWDDGKLDVSFCRWTLSLSSLNVFWAFDVIGNVEQVIFV